MQSFKFTQKLIKKTAFIGAVFSFYANNSQSCSLLFLYLYYAQVKRFFDRCVIGSLNS